jgi:hypothetical protein
MTTMSSQVILGTIGEIYYQALFGGFLSYDKYDSEKDLVQADGRTVELKVQSRFRGHNAFAVNSANETNLAKCLIVDRLIFIEYSLSDIIIIYDCVDRRSVFTSTTEDGRRMKCWPIDQMEILKKVRHPKLAEIMRNFSNSKTLGHFE